MLRSRPAAARLRRLNMEFRRDDLSGAAIHALLRQHLDSAAQHSPPESIHALDIDGLRQPGVTFWSCWEADQLLGCCALKELDATHGEVKSMRTVDAHQGRGVGAHLLGHLLAQARERGYRRLSLETGSADAFAPARRLYERHGFEYCAPFGDYAEDSWSRFMSLELDPA
jgi:putative acetyltransferase